LSPINTAIGDHFAGVLSRYVISLPGQLSLLLSYEEGEMSTGQRAVTSCGWNKGSSSGSSVVEVVVVVVVEVAVVVVVAVTV